MGIFEDVKGMEGVNLGMVNFQEFRRIGKKKGREKMETLKKKRGKADFETLGGIETMRDGRFEIFKSWPGTRVFPLLMMIEKLNCMKIMEFKSEHWLMVLC